MRAQSGSHAKTRKRPAARRGFTLIEVLIVVVIAALAATIALPGFVRSMRGAELRTATRTVLMAHKYARSTAVVRQTQMAILIDRENRELEIVAISGGGMEERDKFLDSRKTREVDTMLGTGEAAAEAAPAIGTEVVRKLGREVKIDSFRSERGGQETKGVYWIMYYPNGMSDGFELTLTDSKSRSATIECDPISGKTEASFGRF